MNIVGAQPVQAREQHLPLADLRVERSRYAEKSPER